MATQILDTDIMILQKEGDFDVHDPSYDRDKYPNLKYDLKHFHFLGSDLRYSVENYIYEEHKYVRIDGDTMFGNLKIKVPKDTSIGIENSPVLTLEGFRNSGTYASIHFTNSLSSTDRTLFLDVVSNADENATPYYFQFDKKTRLTEHSELVFHKTDVLAKNSITAAGKGYLRHLVSEDAGPFLLDDDSYKRVEWNDDGGILMGGNPERIIVEWTGAGGLIRADKELIKWTGSHAEYEGDILVDTDMVNKGYVDSVAGGYIPLVGTRPEDTEVLGPIDFTSQGGLNAKFGSKLIISADDDDAYLTIGGDQNRLDTIRTNKVHLYKSLKLDTGYGDVVKIEEVPYPDTVAGSTVDDNNAIPKKYVDDGDEVLQQQIDGLTQIASPPGMINAYAGDTDPDGWYICDGRTINQNDDPYLYAILGSKIPDLSGRWLVQKGGGVGNTMRTNVQETTALPQKGRVTQNNGLQYVKMGSHRHGIGAKALLDMINSNSVAITAQTAGLHSHKSGRQTVSPSGSNSNQRFDPYDLDVNVADTSKAGEHSHSVKAEATPPNNDNLLAYVNSEQIYMYANDWDLHTRPNSYVINWIIKR